MASTAIGTSSMPLIHLRNSNLIVHMPSIGSRYQNLYSERVSFGFRRRDDAKEIFMRKEHIPIVASCALSQDAVVAAPATGEGVSVSSSTIKDGKMKIRLNVSKAKSEAIFDNVFSKMVAAAQPIPGFRRVKGGKTPNIPKNVLLEILGPAKVYKQVIKKIINSSVAEYVEKEKLKVSKNIQVEQSLTELESTFEPGTKFSFDAVLELQET